MESSTASDTGELRKSGGRGSLESPEVYENVPGHVIPIIEREFDDFDTEAAQASCAARRARTSSSASA